MEENKNAVYFPFHGRELSDEAGVRSSSSSSSGAGSKQVEEATSSVFAHQNHVWPRERKGVRNQVCFPLFKGWAAGKGF